MRLQIRIIATCAAFFIISADPAAGHNRRGNDYWLLSRHVGAYGSGFIGGAFGGGVDFDGALELNLDSGFLVGATLGYDSLFASPTGDVRLEGEVSYRSQELQGLSGDIGVTAVLANGWYDFDMGGPVVPYAGIGLGIGFIGNDVGDDAGFAFQFGGGLTYHVNYRLFLGFNYRYLTTDMGSALDYWAHQGSVSAGFKF